MANTDPTLNPNSPPFKTRRSTRNQALAGTALGLLIAGALVAGDSIFSDRSASAAVVPETQIQAAQAPDFADLVQKVSPAVVSIRVRETTSPNANSEEESGDPSQGFGDLPPEMKKFFEQMPNMPKMPQQN